MDPISLIFTLFTGFISISLTIITGAISVAVAFYIKEYLQKRSEFKKFRIKIEKIAGKNAVILYSGTGIGQQVFKIADIDEHGVVLKDELQTIYVPVSKLITSDVVLPVDNYEEAKIQKVAKDMQRFSKEIMPMMFQEMFPPLMKAMKDVMAEEFMADEGDFNAVIGIKVRKVLSDEGFEIKKTGNKKLKS